MLMQSALRRLERDRIASTRHPGWDSIVCLRSIDFPSESSPLLWVSLVIACWLVGLRSRLYQNEYIRFENIHFVKSNDLVKSAIFLLHKILVTVYIRVKFIFERKGNWRKIYYRCRRIYIGNFLFVEYLDLSGALKKFDFRKIQFRLY